MEIDVSVSYIDTYYMQLSRAELLGFIILRVKFRKFSKMVWNVKNWNYKIKIRGAVGTSSVGFLCSGLTKI